MPRELIARDVEKDFDKSKTYATPEEAAKNGPNDWLEWREDDLSIEWGRADMVTWVPVESDSIQLTIKHSTWVPRNDVGRPRLDTDGHWNGEFFHDRALVESRELYSASLTRKQVNHLIKTLRKARDQVFGTDE